MAEMNEVTILRLKLREALGDKADKYFEIMKNWFRMKIGKEDFDLQCRCLMPVEAFSLHNRFILALLRRCQILADRENKLSSTSLLLEMQPHREHRHKTEDKRKKQKVRDRGAFEAVDLVDYIPPSRNYPPPNPPPPSCVPTVIAPVPYEAFLPDSATLMGRFLLSGWDLGLENTEEEAAQCLSVALKLFLKSVLLAMFQQRSGFRLRDNKFIYAVGNPVPNPWLKNFVHLDNGTRGSDTTAFDESRTRVSREEAEQKAAFELACATSQRGYAVNKKPPVSLFNLYDALKLHKSVIKSHMVYTMTMERIISRLHHSSHEDVVVATIAL